MRKYLGLALASACILALQVTFTRIFSIVIWYHFTYLLVGVALLGGSAAGTMLAVLRWDRERLEKRIGNIAVLGGLAILVTLVIVSLLRIDPLGGTRAIVTSLGGLLLYFAALFAIFFLGGLTVAGIFSLWSKDSHQLYFADLMGASLGTLGIVTVIQMVGGPGALVLIGLLMTISGLLLGARLPRVGQGMLVSAYVFVFLLVTVIHPRQLPVPDSKELGWALKYQNVEQPDYTRWNPVARVDVLPPTTFSNDIRWIISGGISPTLQPEANPNFPSYPLRLVTLDGTSITALHAFDGDLSRYKFLKEALASTPYQVVTEEPKVLTIGVGGGLDILLAKVQKASHVTAVELNGDLVNLLEGPYADYTGNLAAQPDVEILNGEGRSYLTRNTERFDIIQGLGVDNFAALSGGAYILSESYIYTVEAFELALNRLTEHGVFAWTRQTNEPPREMLRLVGLAAEALRRQGISQPGANLAVVGNTVDGWATLLMSPSPFTQGQADRLTAWATQNGFTLLHNPLVKLDNPYADYATTDDPKGYEAAYPFNIYPVTDDDPFFYNYFRWNDFQGRSDQMGDVNNRFPIGNIILITMLAASLIAATAFVVVPLYRRQRGGLKSPLALPTLTYFAILGMAYIFIEVTLIQRFTLFIGYPTYAITTTLFSLLLFSALGSLAGKRFCNSPARLRMVFVMIAGLIVLYGLGLTSVFDKLLTLPDTARILVSIAIIAPLAFCMGIPFPTGLQQISKRSDSQSLVAWAWGINGVFSVIGSTLAVVVSMVSNFTAVLLVSAALYLSGVLLANILWKHEAVKESSGTTAVGAPI